jgi:hypothetical protein
MKKPPLSQSRIRRLSFSQPVFTSPTGLESLCHLLQSSSSLSRVQYCRVLIRVSVIVRKQNYSIYENRASFNSLILIVPRKSGCFSRMKRVHSIYHGLRNFEVRPTQLRILHLNLPTRPILQSLLAFLLRPQECFSNQCRSNDRLPVPTQ